MSGWQNISVTLEAQVGPYIAGFQRATLATREFATEVSAAGEKAALAFNKTSGLERFGSKMTRNVTLPIVAAGLVATKMALDFDQAFAKIGALADVPASAMKGLQSQVLQVSDDTHTSATDIANALLLVIRAGHGVAESLDIVRMAAEGSRLGFGDVGQVATTVTSIMHAYAGSGLTAARTMDILTAASKESDLTASDLGSSLGTLSPIASSLGIGFEQLAGILAYLSKNAGGNTTQAISGLRFTLNQVEKVGPGAEKALRAIGSSGAELRKEIADRGLVAALADFQQRLGGGDQALLKILPNARAVAGVLALLKDGGNGVTDSVGKTTHSVGALHTAFVDLSKTDVEKIHGDINKLKNDGIRLGNDLVPVLGHIIHGVDGMVSGFTKMRGPAKEAVLVALGIAAVAGPILKTIALVEKLKASYQALTIAETAAATEGTAAGAAGAAGGVGLAGGGLALAPLAGLSLGGHTLGGPKPLVGDVTKLAAALDAVGKGTGHMRDVLHELGAEKDPFQIFERTHAKANLDAINSSLKSVLQTDGPKVARAAYQDLVKYLERAGMKAKDMKGLFNPFLKALDDSKGKSEGAAGATKHHAKAMQDAGQSAEEYAAKLRDVNLVAVTMAKGARDQFTAAQQLTADQKAVTQATADYATTVRTSTQAVVQAHQAEVQAERTLEQAQRSTLAAQRALSQARIDAVLNLRNLHNATVDAALGERGAVLSLAQAKEQLAALPLDATDLQRQQAQLAVDQAQQGLVEASQAKGDATSAEARGPLQNAINLAAAQQAVNDAVTAEGDARRGVADAARASQQAQVDADKAVKDAADKVHQAQITYLTDLETEAEKHGRLSLAVVAGLDAVKNKLDPNDPLRKNLDAYIKSLLLAIQAANVLNGTSTTTPAGTAVPPARNPDSVGGNHGVGTTTASAGKQPVLGPPRSLMPAPNAPRAISGHGGSLDHQSSAAIAEIVHSVKGAMSDVSSRARSTTNVYTSDAKSFWGSMVFDS